MTSTEFGSIASALADRGLKVAIDAPFGVLTTYGVGGTAAVKPMPTPTPTGAERASCLVILGA